MKNIALVVAHSKNRVIGNKGQIPWHYPNDLRNFKDLTLEHTVIMGRKTYESLPSSVRPLPDRHTIVLTRNPDYHVEHSSVSVCDSVDKALLVANMKTKKNKVFVAGGEEIYRMFLPLAKWIYSTVINIEVEGDTFFPTLDCINTKWIFNWGDSYYRNLHYRSTSDNFEYATLYRWRD